MCDVCLWHKADIPLAQQSDFGGKAEIPLDAANPGLSKNGPPNRSTDQIILSYNRKETASSFDLKDF